VFQMTTMRRRALHRLILPVAVMAVTGAFAGPAHAAEAATTGGAPTTVTPRPIAKPSLLQLSDERLLTRWANPARIADIYRRHSAGSRKITRLHFFTEDGFPEVYLLLRQYTDAQHREWVQIRVPRRPNGAVGWVLRDALGPFHVNHFQLIVNRRTLRATLLKSGRKVWSARVGVGKASTPTPAGHFWVREKFRFRNTPVYGTHAIGTSAYAPTLSDWPGGGVVGMHGTNEPGLIPGRPSHGCIRIKNADIGRLWRILPLGTPLWIR
jgi:hypothetical protein